LREHLFCPPQFAHSGLQMDQNCKKTPNFTLHATS
jgi:hypothetical protein